jgi:hypothetical protein
MNNRQDPEGVARDQAIDITPFRQIGEAAQRVLACCADVRDHQRRMQRELNRRHETKE